MTASEIRATTLCYFRIRGLLDQPLPDPVRDMFNDFLQSTAATCHAITENSGPSRWARGIVGPVLAAAMSAAIWMREDVHSQVGALRIFGIAGERQMSTQKAWQLVRPYLSETVLSDSAIEEICQQVSMRLNLPRDPTPIDLLEELTRRRSGHFPIEVSHWLNEHFREHPDSQDAYARVYRRTLDDMTVLNARGGMEKSIAAHWHSGVPSRQDWEEIVCGRMPLRWVEQRAANAAVRQFIVDYYDHWNAGRDKPSINVA
jgi:hypothetical protein